jgi:hypothetical protein
VPQWALKRDLIPGFNKRPTIGIMHVIRVGARVAQRSFLAGECVPVLVGVNVVHARCAARAPR